LVRARSTSARMKAAGFLVSSSEARSACRSKWREIAPLEGEAGQVEDEEEQEEDRKSGHVGGPRQVEGSPRSGPGEDAGPAPQRESHPDQREREFPSRCGSASSGPSRGPGPAPLPRGSLWAISVS